MMELLTLMPPFWAEDPALVELVEAINAAAQDFSADAQALLQSGAVSTSQEPWISMWEKLYGTATEGSSLQDRRGAVMAKMRNRGLCTPRKIREVASAFYGGEVEVEEHPETGSFIIRFVGQSGTPPFLSDVTAAIEMIKPAHLVFSFEFRYLLICEVQQMTLAELEQTTLDHFAGGTYYG